GGGYEQLAVDATPATTDIVDTTDTTTVSLGATGQITEAGGTVTYTATVDNAPASDLTVTLSNGETITIEAGETSGTVDVTVAADEDAIADASSMSATITGTDGGGYEQLAVDATPATTDIVDTTDTTTVSLGATGQITEAGGTVTYTATVDNAPASDLEITLSNGETITIEAGETSGTVDVTVAADEDAIADATSMSATITGTDGGGYELLSVDATPATTDIVDTTDTTTVSLGATGQITEAGGTVTYTATVDNAPASDLEITLSNGETITIEAGETSGTVDVTVAADEDAIADATSMSATITGTDGGGYEQLSVDATPATTDIVDTTDTTTVSLGATGQITEAGGTVTYTATVDNAPASDLTVTLSNGETITIQSGQTSGNVDVSVSADDVADESSLSVQIADASGGGYEQLTVNATAAATEVIDLNEAPVAEDDSGFSPANAELVGEMNFDEGVPSAMRGSVSTESDGMVGDGADFSSAKVKMSDLDLNGDPGAQTTVSMWVQADPSGSWEMLVASDRYDLVMLNGDIGFNTGRGDLFGTDADELADGEWHQIVATFTNGDPTQNTIYIDGVEQEMSQVRGSPSSSNANINSEGGDLYFGSWGASNGYRFSGSMDEVKVFDGPLSESEVDQLYSIESQGVSADMGGASAVESTTITIDVLANDTDADGDALTITDVSEVVDADGNVIGTAEVVDGKVEFTPNAEYEGLTDGESVQGSFTYTISDGQGGTDTATVSVSVLGENDAVSDIVVTGTTVTEGAEAGTVVSTLDAVDPDTGETFTYEIVGGSDLFEIVGNQVVVKADADIDFETAESHDLTLQVTDSGGATHQETVTIDVTDINEAPEAQADGGFSPANAELVGEMNFDEGVPSAMRGSVSTESDGMVGDGADFSSAKVKMSDLDLNGDPGAQTTVSMWVQADPSGSWEMLVASDRYDLVMLNGDIGFNTGRGDLFGTDADELADGEWHQIVATFTNGDPTQNTIYIDGVEQEMSQVRGSPSSSNANINSEGGDLYFGSWGASNGYRFSGSMDEVKVFDGPLSESEVDQLYSIESQGVSADMGGASAVESTTITIDVLANDTDADGDALTITDVSEVVDADGNVIGTAEVVDGKVEFTPNAEYEGLTDGESVQGSFTYTISDGQGGTDTATVSVSVLGENDAVSDIVVTGTTVTEGAEAGTVVSTLDAVDPDTGETFTYEIVGGSDLFEIVGNQVVVKADADIDFETAESHDIVLQVTDSGGNSHQETVTINVSDVEETAETSGGEAPTDISFSGTTVEEGAAAGTVVATLQTIDQSTGDTFSYELVRDDSGHFEIVDDQLVVKAGADIDYESEAVHELSIQVTDSTGNTYSETVSIRVDDVQEVMSATHEGTRRNDHIDGDDGNDVIDGMRGNDHLDGEEGHDVLLGGEGNDHLDGGEGHDRLEGGEGNDKLEGGEGNDYILGGEGNDDMRGGEGDDTFMAGAGNDQMRGGEGDDRFVAGEGNDRAIGGEGNDLFEADPFSGSDYFSGGEGGGWTDVIQLNADAVPAGSDPDAPWSIEVDGEQVQYDIADHALSLDPDASGVITFSDGSELTFDGVERIEW
ncbi:MAG: immunoglobulin-like domain-containing protein, partial [Sedimenticola sp.]